MADMSEINHLDDETLDRYALGKLSEVESAPVEEHLLVCHACQDKLDAADAFISAFRAAAPLVEAEAAPAPEPWYRRLFSVPKLVWVPALTAVAIVGIVLQTGPSLDRAQTVNLRTYRGAEAASEAESGSLLHLRLATEGLKDRQPYRVEIVDSRGTKIWYGVVAWNDGVAEVNVPRLLAAGQYWVRLYEVPPDSELVREYGLRVR
jgi:hypothetical protein